MRATLRSAPAPAVGGLVQYYMGGPRRYARLLQPMPNGQWQVQLLGRMHRTGWRPSKPSKPTVCTVWVHQRPPACALAHWRTCTQTS